MPQLCSKCSRANPPQAIYCFFDGFVLGGHQRAGGPISVGKQPFNSPFVFPTGRTCRSFDELALACQEEWSVACELLRDGYLESFFGGLGRVDLARAAKEAARFPDVERGLDQLLEKIPSTVLDGPKLRVDPVEVSLGLLDSSKERTFTLELQNAGGRLLYGTASSPDSSWISLGEAGATEKHFQFTDEAKITVHVRPGNLRASNKPIEAKILLESNGGTIPVILKAEKPVKVFPTGPLKGAKTPRQVAEMAMKAAKDVGPLFESGDVEKWYETNGWIYPVKTPAASGLAAIQQFFEALGVTKPPKVEVDQREFLLTAEPREKVKLSVEVSTQEKKAVWAHATSNVPWLEVSKPRCNGRTATVNVSVPSVPDRPGEVLEGELTVIGNGNVRWLIPVRLEVGGELVAAEVVSEPSFDFRAAPPPLPPPKSSPDVKVEAPKKAPPPPPVLAPRGKRKGGGWPSAVQLLPAALLALAVSCVVGFDLLSKKRVDAPPEIGDGTTSEGWNYNVANLRDKRPRVGVSFTKEERFGVVLRNVDDPDNDALWKKLTASPNGDTNNTIVKIGESDGYYFGDVMGGRATFITPLNTPARSVETRRAALPKPRVGWISRMRYNAEQVVVMQHVEIVPGKTGYLDTVLVYYSIKNNNTTPLKIGLRVMLDTYIGDNDGVPFTIPGERGFVDKQRTLEEGQIPDYVEVIENPDNPKDPGTIVRLGLRGIRLPDRTLTEPGRLVICRFPNSNARWDFPREDMKEKGAPNGDSCVAIYWPEAVMEPKEVRHLAFTYGMSNLDLGDRLTLSVPTSSVPNREFVVTCYVYDAKKGQKVTLNLPDGLSLSGGDKADKVIDEDAGRTQVFWKVRATRDGTFPVTASSGPATSRETKVIVKALGLFG